VDGLGEHPVCHSKVLWTPYVSDADIIFSSCAFSSFFFFSFSFFLRLISAVGDWMYTILSHMMWPLCKFRMHVWKVLHAARWKIQDTKNRHLGTIAQLCPAISSQLRHISTIGNKLLNSNTSFTCPPQYGELRPTNGWDPLASLGHPSKFQRISCLGFVTAPTSLNGGQQNFAGCLAVSLAGTLCTVFLKNWTTKLMAVALSNLNRFSKFFHCYTQR